MPERGRTLASLTWPQVASTARQLVLVVPVGSIEQHGLHLPLGTDTTIASALTDALAARRPEVVVAPALPFGSSGEHAGFPGTLSIGQGVLSEAVIELVRSARQAFTGVVVVSAHGGNAEPLARAAERCRADGDRLLVWSARVPGGDAHAGRTETSLMLAVEPGAVRLLDAVAGAREPLAALMPALRAGGVRSVSPSGVLGDPTGASAAEGRAILGSLADDLVGSFDRWRTSFAATTAGAGAAVPVRASDGGGAR